MATMKCIGCDTAIPHGATNCPMCGAKIITATNLIPAEPPKEAPFNRDDINLHQQQKPRKIGCVGIVVIFIVFGILGSLFYLNSATQNRSHSAEEWKPYLYDTNSVSLYKDLVKLDNNYSEVMDCLKSGNACV